ncbi:MAG: DNA repair protein RecN, partial [Candidatus Methylomirabilis sp.]|nr:DNA repair protein RecN [Deltaproteobacteria bacterium]
TRFRAQITPRGEIGPAGADQVEFLMAPNAGEEPKPLVKIASGGELSRAMLAIKKSLLGASAPPSLVFDEVDAGIGGETAVAVGDLLAEVAGSSQLLAITHLAQIAARATTHYRVEKAEEGGRTVSRVQRLGEKEREREIARMLGGERHGDAALKAAGEMLRAGAKGGPAKGRKGEAT